MLKYFNRIVPVILFTLSSFLRAQTEPYLIKNITLQTGIGQNTINTIIQDKKGFIWFATSNGLSRYDGYNFYPYVKVLQDSTTLASNNVSTLFEDTAGILWAGTTDGILDRFDRRTGIFTHFDLRLSDKYSSIPDPRVSEFPVPISRLNENSITSIKEDGKGNLWIGTWGAGIIRFDLRTMKPHRFIQNAVTEFRFPANKNNIKSILIDSDGIIWIASMLDGLKKMSYDKQKESVSFVKFTLPGDKYKIVTSIVEDLNKNIYVGTYDGGFFRFNAVEKQIKTGQLTLKPLFDEAKKNSSSISNKIITMLADQKGNIWLGTFGSLLKYDPNKNEISKIENKAEDEKYKSPNVLSLCEDRGGILWAGFALGGGINKIEYSQIKFSLINKQYPLKKSLNDETVWSLYLDKANILWIGTEKGGLNKFDRNRKTFTYYSKTGSPGSISDNCIRSIGEDKFGDLWIGTYSGGLNHFNKTTGVFTSFKADSLKRGAISHNQIQAVYVDSSNTYWIGTFGGGLNKFQLKGKYSGEPIVFTKYKYSRTDPFSISSDRVYAIYEDRRKNLWIGTFGGGLNKLDRKTGRFISYRNIPGDESSLEDNNVVSIGEDSDGNLLIATYGGGVNKFNPTSEKFTRIHNESSSVAYTAIQDDNKNLWITSDKGVFKYNTATHSFTQYHLDDGIQGTEFSGGAYFKSPKGEIFLGGTNGINYFYPYDIVDNSTPPPIAISRISVFNESLRAEKDTLVLSFNENFVSFQFASLDYTSPNDHKYSYILEGLNDTWINTDAKERLANYNNLSPGTYTFRVKGTNSDDVWNDQGASVTLIIKPLYYQTIWFRIGALLAVIGILYYLFTLRYKQLLEIEKLKTKIAADLHDNVGAGLTEISILSELTANFVKSGIPIPQKNLDTISEKARALVDSMSDIVWVVNPKRDSLYDLILRLKDSYSDTFSAMGIAFKTNNLEDFASIKLPMDYKQNLYLIFKEAINNSIKHSKCRQISLDAKVEKFSIELALTDDGSGFDVESVMRGNGIANIKNRTKQINGIVEVLSTDAGTKIKFIGRISRKDKLRLLMKK